MTGRKLQPVSFNVADDYERSLYEYALAQQKYFSRYVKRLIERDRDGKEAPVVEVMPIAPVDKITPDKRALAKGYL